jgi:hypothetical protein
MLGKFKHHKKEETDVLQSQLDQRLTILNALVQGTAEKA